MWLARLLGVLLVMGHHGTASGPNPSPNPSALSPSSAATLQLRGGARDDGARRRKSSDASSTSSRVKFSKGRRQDRESEMDESWQDHSKSLGAPDGKHTPFKPSANRGREADGDETESNKSNDYIKSGDLHTPGKASKRRSHAMFSSDQEDSVGDESSVRFARLGAPDGKHTPAGPRSGSVSRWSELLDSSTQPPPYQSPERHARKLKSLSTPTPSRADSKSSDTQLSSRRVLFAVDEGEELSGRGRNKRSNPASVTYPPPTRATKLDSRSNARERSKATKATKATTPSTASKSHASAKQGQAAINGASSSEEDGHVDGEGGSMRHLMRHSRHLQAPEQQRQARSEEQGLSEDEMDSGGDSIEADSDYDELMSLRRNNLPTPHPGGAASSRSTKMCGVGMQVEIDKHARVRVTKLAEGGAAAEHGGIVEGDAIEAVDGMPLRAKSLQQVAVCICGPAGSYVTLHLLRGKKEMVKLSVKLVRRSLHPPGPVASLPGASVDDRIASLVADMTYPEVQEMVAELAQEEEKDKVWKVWKSVHGSASGTLPSRVPHHQPHQSVPPVPPVLRAHVPDMAHSMRAHDSNVDTVLKHEEARAQRQASVRAKKEKEAVQTDKTEAEYRGVHAVYKSAGARRAGFRQRTKASTGGAGEEVFQELQRLNSGDIVKLKGNTYGAKGSTRSGSKETSRPDGIKTSQLPSLNRKLKIDFGGL